MWQRIPFSYFHDPLGESALPGLWAECISEADLFISVTCTFKKNKPLINAHVFDVVF